MDVEISKISVQAKEAEVICCCSKKTEAGQVIEKETKATNSQEREATQTVVEAGSEKRAEALEWLKAPSKNPHSQN